MKKTLLTLLTAASTLLPSAAQAQTRLSAAATTNEAQTGLLRAEHLGTGGYAFIDAQFGQDANNVYFEGRRNTGLPYGVDAGLDLNGGTGANTVLRGNLERTWANKDFSNFFQLRIAPPLIGEGDFRAGSAGQLTKGPFAASHWASFDFGDDIGVLGEVMLSAKATDSITGFFRVEHYPWSGYNAQVGISTILP